MFAVLFSVAVAVLFLISFAFYNDSSRKFIIDYSLKCLQSDNFSLKLEGANKSLTHVDKIFVKFSDNSLEAYDINFEREKLFSRPKINIKKVIFRAAKEKNEKNRGISGQKFDPPKNTESKKSDSLDSGINLSETLSSTKKVKLFIESLKIAEMTFVFGKRNLKYENLSYYSEGGRDFLSMKPGKTSKSSCNLVLDGNSSGTIKGDFKNIEGFSGSFTVNQLEKSEPKYEIEISNSEYKVKVDAKGALTDKLNTVLISNAWVKYRDKKQNFSGKILLNKNKADLFTTLSLSNFVDISKVPAEITKNFQNISTSIVVEKKKDKSICSDMEFKRDGNRLGSCHMVLQGKHLSLKSDVSWINFWGNRLKTLDVQSENLKNFAMNLSGTDILGGDFKINSAIVYENNICIQKLTCDLQKGKIVLDRPLVFDGSLNTSLKFNLQDLAFLKKYFKVEGSAIGNLLLKNGLPNIDAKIDRLIKDNFEIYNGNVSGNSNDLKIDVKNAKFMGNILKNVMLKKKVIR